MAKEKKENEVQNELIDFNFPAVGITIKAANQADADAKYKELYPQ